MIGSRLAHYEITAKLGEGGMGEVYRAKDSRLGRQVAIKVLPDAVGRDAERLARFQREAQVLASLNHPNIAQVYGLEEHDEGWAIVLELVDGESLAERLARGALPHGEAKEIALQIARALEAAHESDIVHRDLKPANVMLAADGTVKVLDFGLAKAAAPRSESIELSASPTLTAAATQAGVILGTAAYMSPEQARGRTVDRRADIWAFGCVLYEMLTARRAFQGEDVAEILAHIISSEPDLGALPGDLPAAIRELIGRCLRKDASMRLPDIAAARIAILEADDKLADAPSPAAHASRTTGLRGLALAVLLVALGLALGFGLRSFEPAPPPVGRAATHFDLRLDPPLGHVSMALSPDGATAIYSGKVAGRRQLFRRDLSGFASRPIPETEGGRWPFFSPDGERVGFFAAGRMKVMSLEGGLAEAICAVPGAIQGVIWYPDDRIVYASRMFALPHEVRADGSDPRPLEIPGLEAGQRLTFPAPLPVDDVFLATLDAPDPGESHIVVVSTSEGWVKTLLRGRNARFLPPATLLFLQRDRLMAAPFDATTLELEGPERPADLEAPAIELRDAEDQFEIAIARNGTVLYPSGRKGESADLFWLSRDGTLQATGIPGVFPRLDREGRRVLAQHRDGEEDVFLVELDEGRSTRLTFADGSITYPLWSADGREVIYGYQEGAGYSIFALSTEAGSEPRRLLGESEELPSIVPTSIHPDGRVLVYAVHPETSRDIYLLGADGQVESLLHTSANERAGAVSPDGRLFAYISDEEGADELSLRELPDTGRRWTVASAGSSPVWSRDGAELFFLVGNALFVAGIEREGGLRVGEAEEIFRSDRLDRDDWGNATFDAAPDGRLLVALGDPDEIWPRVVLDWKPAREPAP